METIELLQKNQESFTVPELRKKLGIGKTEAYWLIKHKDILTVRINGRMRIMRSSFDECITTTIWCSPGRSDFRPRARR